MARNIKCIECGRIFDMYVEEQADEWYNGHDCEEPQDGCTDHEWGVEKGASFCVWCSVAEEEAN